MIRAVATMMPETTAIPVGVSMKGFSLTVKDAEGLDAPL